MLTAGSFPQTLIPEPVGWLPGVYEVRTLAPSGENAAYVLKVNNRTRLNDACSPFVDPPDVGMTSNMTTIWVQCPEEECSVSKYNDANPNLLDEERLDTSPSGVAADVLQPTSLVQLFEWPYDDVARECRVMESTWTAVEVAAPHALSEAQGYNIDVIRAPQFSWASRRSVPLTAEQDTSFLRSAFERMVEACLLSGIQVYVALELNQASTDEKRDKFQDPARVKTLSAVKAGKAVRLSPWRPKVCGGGGCSVRRPACC